MPSDQPSTQSSDRSITADGGEHYEDSLTERWPGGGIGGYQVHTGDNPPINWSLDKNATANGSEHYEDSLPERWPGGGIGGYQVHTGDNPTSNWSPNKNSPTNGTEHYGAYVTERWPAGGGHQVYMRDEPTSNEPSNKNKTTDNAVSGHAEHHNAYVTGGGCQVRARNEPTSSYEALYKNDGMTAQRSSTPADIRPEWADAYKDSKPKWNSDIQPKNMSDFKYLKHTTGDGNMKHFMDKYNLKMYEDEDYAEAKAILRTFKGVDQEGYEAAQPGRINWKKD